MKRMFGFWMALAVCAVAGCSPDPLDEYRVGDPVDVDALAERFAGTMPDEVTLVQVKYEYYECPFERDGVKYAVQFSKESKIIGLWAMMPCPEDEAVERIAALKNKVIDRYRDKLECCGTAKGEIVADIHYEHKAQCIEFICQDRAFAEKIARNNEMSKGKKK